MTINDAKTEAITRGGYVNPSCYSTDAQILLDPAFWRSLGKAMGWGNTGVTLVKYKFVQSMERPSRRNPLPPLEKNIYEHKCEAWQYQWHCFIDHIADGKTAEDFFSNL